MAAAISNIFVLMLENRSFDHMLGFSAIAGINGLTGTESNTHKGKSYPVSHPADAVMPVDPGHEFTDVVKQLCGPNASYPPGGNYPLVNNSGFVSDYAPLVSNKLGEIMQCFSPSQLPVLNALAREFAVCDGWHASVPGPDIFIYFSAAGLMRRVVVP